MYTGFPRFSPFGLLLQQQEGGPTIPVTRGFEVLDKLPAVPTNCELLQIVKEQLIVGLKDGTTQLDRVGQQRVHILIPRIVICNVLPRNGVRVLSNQVRHRDAQSRRLPTLHGGFQVFQPLVPFSEVVQLWYVLGKVPGAIRGRLLFQKDDPVAPAVHLGLGEFGGVHRVINILAHQDLPFQIHSEGFETAVWKDDKIRLVGLRLVIGEFKGSSLSGKHLDKPIKTRQGSRCHKGGWAVDTCSQMEVFLHSVQVDDLGHQVVPCSGSHGGGYNKGWLTEGGSRVDCGS